MQRTVESGTRAYQATTERHMLTWSPESGHVIHASQHLRHSIKRALGEAEAGGWKFQRQRDFEQRAREGGEGRKGGHRKKKPREKSHFCGSSNRAISV